MTCVFSCVCTSVGDPSFPTDSSCVFFFLPVCLVTSWRDTGMDPMHCPWAMPWLKHLVTGLLPQRPVFNLRLVFVGYVVEKVALGQVFLCVCELFPVISIPAILHSQYFVYLPPALGNLNSWCHCIKSFSSFPLSHNTIHIAANHCTIAGLDNL
jgi:hypothetical protein